VIIVMLFTQDIIQFNRQQFTGIKEMETDLIFMFSSKKKLMMPSSSSVDKNMAESQVNYMRSFLETYAYEGDIYLASMKDENEPEREPDH